MFSSARIQLHVHCAGNKGLTGLISNPVLANGVAGLATSATAQATIERFVLWTLRDTVSFPSLMSVWCILKVNLHRHMAVSYSFPSCLDQSSVD